MPPANAIAYGSAGPVTSRAVKRRYRGFANGMLWPLLHSRVGLSEFRRTEFATYLAVNTALTKALVPLLRADDTIWVHDYHLFPLGQALRDAGVGDPIGFFLHVPFPPPSLFECLPQGDKVLRTLAAYDAVGVQVPEDAANLNALLDKLGIVVRAAAFPVGIDPDAFRQGRASSGNRAGGDASDRQPGGPCADPRRGPYGLHQGPAAPVSRFCAVAAPVP
jgi:trehalose-6-phosphate synthase